MSPRFSTIFRPFSLFQQDSGDSKEKTQEIHCLICQPVSRTPSSMFTDSVWCLNRLASWRIIPWRSKSRHSPLPVSVNHCFRLFPETDDNLIGLWLSHASPSSSKSSLTCTSTDTQDTLDRGDYIPCYDQL